MTKLRKRMVIAAAVLLALILTGLFGWTTFRGSREFSAYRAQTLENPLWTREKLSVSQCVDQTIEWAQNCPGISNWVEAAVPDVARDCFSSQDRKAFCDAAGDSIHSTRFGYEECGQRLEGVVGKRKIKALTKWCAKSYRVLANYCDEL